MANFTPSQLQVLMPLMSDSIETLTTALAALFDERNQAAKLWPEILDKDYCADDAAGAIIIRAVVRVLDSVKNTLEHKDASFLYGNLEYFLCNSLHPRRQIPLTVLAAIEATPHQWSYDLRLATNGGDAAGKLFEWKVNTDAWIAWDLISKKQFAYSVEINIIVSQFIILDDLSDEDTLGEIGNAYRRRIFMAQTLHQDDVSEFLNRSHDHHFLLANGVYGLNQLLKSDNLELMCQACQKITSFLRTACLHYQEELLASDLLQKLVSLMNSCSKLVVLLNVSSAILHISMRRGEPKKMDGELCVKALACIGEGLQSSNVRDTLAAMLIMGELPYHQSIRILCLEMKMLDRLIELSHSDIFEHVELNSNFFRRLDKYGSLTPLNRCFKSFTGAFETALFEALANLSLSKSVAAVVSANYLLMEKYSRYFSTPDAEYQGCTRLLTRLLTHAIESENGVVEKSLDAIARKLKFEKLCDCSFAAFITSEPFNSPRFHEIIPLVFDEMQKALDLESLLTLRFPIVWLLRSCQSVEQYEQTLKAILQIEHCSFRSQHLPPFEALFAETARASFNTSNFFGDVKMKKTTESWCDLL